MTFDEMCSFDTLWAAFLRTRKNKRSKEGTAAFEYRAVEELLILSKSLSQGNHTPDPLDAFLIYEPKKRLIQAPSFRDKVVQRAENDFVIYPELSPSLTRNTYAAQRGKGTHQGVEHLAENMRAYFLRRKGADEAARKAAGLPYRPTEEWDYADGAVIKGDVRHFFQSIDHERLKRALAERFPDERMQRLMWAYIDQVEGLALGHQSSHIFAVYFTHSIMHFTNGTLGPARAGMYSDDWYVICPDMETAREALRLTRERFSGLGLELNQKTNIFPLRNGIDFCGFHVYLTQTGKVIKKLRHSSSKRMKRRIRKWEEQYAAGEITREKIEESYVAWEAHAKHGDTGALRKQMRARLSAAMARAEHRRATLRLPAPEPGKIERRTKRYGTVNFQSGRRQPGEAGGADQAHQVHQAGK